MTLKPPEALVSSHSSIWSAIVPGVPTKKPGRYSHRHARGPAVAPSGSPAAPVPGSAHRALWLALLSGIPGSGPSGSKPDASWPSAIESAAIALS